MKAICLRVIGSIYWLILLYAITDTKLCRLLLSNFYYYRCDYICGAFRRFFCRLISIISVRFLAGLVACSRFFHPRCLPSSCSHTPHVTWTHSSPPRLLPPSHTLPNFSLHPWSTFSCCSDYFTVTFRSRSRKKTCFVFLSLSFFFGAMFQSSLRSVSRHTLPEVGGTNTNGTWGVKNTEHMLPIDTHASLRQQNTSTNKREKKVDANLISFPLSPLCIGSIKHRPEGNMQMWRGPFPVQEKLIRNAWRESYEPCYEWTKIKIKNTEAEENGFCEIQTLLARTDKSGWKNAVL